MVGTARGADRRGVTTTADASAPPVSLPTPRNGSPGATQQDRHRVVRPPNPLNGTAADWYYHLTSYQQVGHASRMVLQPVNRRSVPEDVFEQIVAEVLSGDMRPGEALPSERRLAEVLGVSRPAVREAIKRLTEAGLVEVRHGDATTVRDFRRHAGLDLLPRLLIRSGELDVAVVRSILETRLHNGPKIAELAATRRRPDVPDLLDAAIIALAAEDDQVERQRHALRFWDGVVDGADSIVYRLMYNNLRATYEPALEALAAMMSEEVGRPELYRRVADAIRRGDAPAAERASRELLEPATSALLAALDGLTADS